MTPPHNNCQQLQIFLQKLWFWKGQGMVTESTLSGIFRETPMAMNLVGLRLMLISSAKVANDIMIMVMLLMLMLMRISSTKIARPSAYCLPHSCDQCRDRHQINRPSRNFSPASTLMGMIIMEHNVEISIWCNITEEWDVKLFFYSWKSEFILLLLLCDKSPMWQKSCVTKVLCDNSPVWQIKRLMRKGITQTLCRSTAKQLQKYKCVAIPKTDWQDGDEDQLLINMRRLSAPLFYYVRWEE